VEMVDEHRDVCGGIPIERRLKCHVGRNAGRTAGPGEQLGDNHAIGALP
jgi:hypothetical protein